MLSRSLETLDVRMAAARALGHFHEAQATDALVLVLKNDKDLALRDRAHESLQTATNLKLPPEAAAWDEALHTTNDQRAKNAQAKKPAILSWFSGN